MGSSDEDLPSPPLSQDQDVRYLFNIETNEFWFNDLGQTEFFNENYEETENLTALKNIKQEEAQQVLAISHTLHYPGKHNFQVSFMGNDEQITKSIPWTFSSEENKLYVGLNTIFPVIFSLDDVPNQKCVIRATCKFKQLDYIKSPVLRCYEHSQNDSELNLGANASRAPFDHVLRCDTEASFYTGYENQERSVLVPYDVWEENGLQNVHNYRFVCLTSCRGGMNRRAINVAFSLECGETILGRQVIEARICACPGRDRRNSEKQILKNKTQDPIPDLKRKISNICSTVATKTPKAETSQEAYVIEVKGYENYVLLKQLADRLDN